MRRPFLMTAATLTAVALLLPLTACNPLSLGDLIPSAQELSAWEEYAEQLDQAQEDLETGPTVAVRVVNNSPAAALVEFVSTAEPPTPPDSDYYLASEYASYPLYTTEIVLVSAGGTVTGTVPCGDTIIVSALAPLDAVGFDAQSYNNTLGIYSDPGNVVFSGVGTVPDSEFSGDQVATVRVVTPATDSLDCAANTLVITLQTAGTASVYDAATGALISGATPGTATVSIE